MSEVTDLPADMLKQYLEQRKDFILDVIRDVIRSDIKHMDQIPMRNNAAQLQLPLEETKNSQSLEQQEQSSNSVEQVVIQMAAEQTGFSADSITLSQRLLDDLNLDSIKSAELILSIAKQFAVNAQLDPSQFANATLQDVVQAIQVLLAEQEEPKTSSAKSEYDHVAGLLMEHVAKMKGFAKESLHLKLRLLEDLNLDLNKTADFVANVAQELGIAEQIDSSGFANGTLAEIYHHFQTLKPTKIERKSISDVLLDEVVQLTGFAKETLHMELRLLDDLNLDSIKTAELISKIMKALNIDMGEVNLDFTVFANATLKEIEQHLSSYTERTVKSAHQESFITPTKQSNRSQEIWVRNFVIDYVNKPRTNRSVKLSSSSRFILVTEQTENSLAKSLTEKLNQQSIFCETVTFMNLKELERLKKEKYSHIVVILPKSQTKNNYSQMVEQLQSVIKPVKDYGYQASITYIQYGGGFFGTRFEQLGAWSANAFASSLHLERPQAKIRVIDLSPNLKAESIVQDILAEITAEEAFVSVGFDQEKVRRVPQAIVQQPAQYQPRSIEWSNEDVILVTGGAKGITAECALATAKASGVKMALVGSSKLESQEIQQTLERFREAGLVCKYYSCDITDQQAVKQMVAAVQTELGAVTGVIHGSGLVQSRRAEQVSQADFIDEIAPKLMGAEHLCEALKDVPPKLFIGLTSIIGVTGMAGNTAYGFANESTQLLLRRFEQENPETQVLSVAYSVWDEIGMGTRDGSINFLKQRGVNPVPIKEGVERFVQLFHNDPQAKQVVVAAKFDGLDTWHPRPVKQTKALRFIEKVIDNYPEVAVTVQTHLDLSKDPYVQDHVFNGTHLFPAVFGLEAMAQAAAYVTGKQDFSQVRIEDIQLTLPIVVNPQTGVTIQIHAEVLEDRRVKAEIQTEQTGFAKTHFAATFVWGKTIEQIKQKTAFPETALPIEPVKDLYGPILFQGPRFQRIQEIYNITHDANNHTGQCLFSTSQQKVDEYLLGDPYYHDTLLQSVLPIIPQDRCLPVEIKSFEGFSNQTQTWKVVSRLQGKAGSHYINSVDVVNDQNQIIQQLKGYKAHIIEHIPSLPTADELNSLTYVDEQRLKQAIQKQSKLLSIELPTVSVTHLAHIHQQNTEKRHNLVLPIFERALTQAGLNGDYELSWNNTGKPVIQKEGTLTNDIHISFSHDDEITICTLGTQPQGCDILPIESHRTKQDWIDLLAGRYQSLLQTLTKQGDSLDEAGSRIWTCLEAAKKTSGTEIEKIECGKTSTEAVEFIVSTKEATYFVLTLPVEFTKPLQRMVAIVTSVQTLKPADKDDNPYGSHHPKNGFVYRFPLTWKETSTISRRANISCFSIWMGRVRELFSFELNDHIMDQLDIGRWGFVTNFVQTEIFGEANINDVIEAHFQLEPITDDSYVEFVCYWHKVKAKGELELIAISRQACTWVEIIGHGLVKKHPYPEFVLQFLKSKLLTVKKERSNVRKHATLSQEQLGQPLFTITTSPVDRSIAQTETFKTALEESNLMGNVYWSNYTIWQGKVRDQYFHRLEPELYRGVGEAGEWIPLNIHIHHLREAMPFDTIQVEMSLVKGYEYGVKLYFEFYKLEANGQKQKLAFGEQELVRMKRDEQGTLHPVPLPEVIKQEFMKLQIH